MEFILGLHICPRGWAGQGDLQVWKKRPDTAGGQSTKISNKMTSGSGMPIIQSSKPLNMNLSFRHAAS